MYKKIGLEIIEKLNNNGFEAYFVGGFVRDSILNRHSNDIDITTNATPKNIIELFDDVNQDGIDYYSLKVNLGGYQYEITSYRSDISYEDNRHPKVSLASTLEEDLKRRDFTINALAMDKNGKITDLFGGASDIDNKTIRIIGDGNIRFKEDALRILRACYFRAKLGFEIEAKTLNSMVKNSHLIKEISQDIIKRELAKLFGEKERFLGIESLIESKTAYHLGIEKTMKYILKNKLDLSFDDVLILSSLVENPILTKTKNQNKLLKLLNNYILSFNLEDSYMMYKLGKTNLCLLIYALNIQGRDCNICDAIEKYDGLAIHSSTDIRIKPSEIKNIFNIDGANLGGVMTKIEINIINNNLENNYDSIISFIKKIV